MENTNQKIIDAVISKAKEKCPESLALIAVYGSVCTRDEYERSDLDLLILINDDSGWQLADGFILDDKQVGYDIYCTTWKQLEGDAECHNAHISKLMDSKIVYVSDDLSIEKLNRLKEKAAGILNSDKKYERAYEIQGKIREVYADVMIAKTIGKMRAYAAYVISLSLDMVMLWNGKYFKKGIKRTFEELDGLNLPNYFLKNTEKIICAQKVSELRECLTDFLSKIMEFTKQDKKKSQPSKEALSGTYEEMFSNWKNKMHEAMEKNDVFSSFMNMASLHFMLEEISDELDIMDIEVMEDFSAESLGHNVTIFDNALEKYLEEYEKVGIKPKHFKDADAFAEAYLSSENS